MSQSSEHSSNETSSQEDMECHSESESELEEKQIIPIDYSAGFMFLDIWFPLLLQFPKLYLRLQEVISNIDDVLLKPYEWTHDCVKDPKSALAYIITHFNIEKVSNSLRAFPKLNYNQVYYSTYIDTSQYTTLQCYIDISAHNLRIHNALVQKRLELQIRYARYQMSEDLNPYLLQCIL